MVFRDSNRKQSRREGNTWALASSPTRVWVSALSLPSWLGFFSRPPRTTVWIRGLQDTTVKGPTTEPCPGPVLRDTVPLLALRLVFRPSPVLALPTSSKVAAAAVASENTFPGCFVSFHPSLPPNLQHLQTKGFKRQKTPVDQSRPLAWQMSQRIVTACHSADIQSPQSSSLLSDKINETNRQ